MKTFSNPTFETLSAEEWLLTNGLGGYASSSLCGANTRRYHGLLVASLNPPTQRMAVVSKVEETISTSRDCVVSISSNQYPDQVVHPQGYQYLKSFERNPLPVMTFHVCGAELQKTVFMPQGSNTTVVEYRNTGESAFKLRMNPWLVWRDYHSLMHENATFDFWHELKGNALRVHAHYGAPALYIGFSAGNFKQQNYWVKNLHYNEETARGLDDTEDCRCIGEIEVYLHAGEQVHLVFTLEEAMLKADPEKLKQAELKRLEALNPHSKSVFFNDLSIAADQFLVQRSSTNSETLIAGYPWFTDWGRDTMIAMRGLVIAAGRKEEARSIIRTFLKYLDKGMLPNRFPDQGEMPEYNTIDATLWLFVVLYEYWLKFDDLKFVATIFPHLETIIAAHREGTRFNIHTLPEGLLFGGAGLSQLTWMDARIGDHVVTPRQGCPVEVNALWFNALKIAAFFQEKLQKGIKGKKKAQPEIDYESLAATVRDAFRRYFFNDQWYLNDVVIPGQYADASIRPNQIYAVSLPFPLLESAEEKMVLAIVKQHLLTPLGLRTLNPGHPDFKAEYKGDPRERDNAYHQGTVWPFLLGEYWLAHLKVNKYTQKAQREVLAGMKALEDHFYNNGCLYGISEVFDGMNPGRGKGCFQQAWSVGMLLKVWSVLKITN